MKPYLNNVSGKSTSDITMLSGGLNLCHDRSFLRDDQMPFMWNVGLHETPTLSTRSNRLSLAWFLKDTTDYASGQILAMLPVTSKKVYIIESHRTAENIFADNRVYKYEVIEGEMKRIYVGSIEGTGEYSMCECRDANKKYVIISAQTERYKVEDTVGVGESAIEKAEDNNAGILACHKNRLWIGKGTSLKFSRLREFDNFDASDGSAGEINITNAQGDITALVPYDGKLIIFCEYSWHVLYGSSPDSSVDQFSLVDMDDGIGCISEKTTTICNRRLYFMDRDTSVYQYNGSSLIRISEPYGSDNYASYGGIKGLKINQSRLDNIVMSSYDSYLYIALTRNREIDSKNDTLAVYDTNNRVWWLEDGDFTHLIKWETDAFYGKTDHLLGAKYNGDILFLNRLERENVDRLFNVETRLFEEKEIQYAFESKTWLLGTVKRKKTLTDIWFQANAEGKIGVCDHWTMHNDDAWNNTLDKGYIVLGDFKKTVIPHDIINPTIQLHEGMERQRFIIPKMYMQKINAFSLRIEGKGYGAFYMLEKEWRIK